MNKEDEKYTPSSPPSNFLMGKYIKYYYNYAVSM
jgi:hypothetical protein